MPIEWDVDPETGLLLFEAIGLVSPAAYVDVWEEVIADPRVGSSPRIVADFRRVEVTLGGADVRGVAAGAKRINDFVAGGRMAIVATQEASFGLARMYEALVEATGLHVRVFRDYDPARQWALTGVVAGAET